MSYEDTDYSSDCLQSPPHSRTLTTEPEPFSHRETDDAYRWVLFQIDPDWRVILCKDGIQYILQKRCPSRWVARSYPNSREGLRDSIRRHVGFEGTDKAKAWLDTLPDYIEAQHAI